MLKNFWYVAEDSKAVGSKPKKVRLLGHDFVLFRNRQGKVSCLSDVCIHRGASLSGGRIVDGCVECPYHGWRFASDGRCTRIPAQPASASIPRRARVDAYPTEERYGWIWVFLGDLPASERPPIPEFPEYGNSNWRVINGEFVWNADYARVIENGLDFAHAPFVHRGAFGDPDNPEVESFEIEHHEWGARAEMTFKPPLSRGLWRLGRRQRTPVRACPGFHMSGGLMRLHLRLGRGWELIIYDVNTPVDENTTHTRWAAARNFFRGRWADKDAHKRTMRIFFQDAEVVEEVKPELLPFDLSEELSVKSDGLQIAYRKMRKQFIERGWAIDSDRLNREVKGKRAMVIPSPARSGDEREAKTFVLSPTPVVQQSGS